MFDFKEVELFKDLFQNPLVAAASIEQPKIRQGGLDGPESSGPKTLLKTQLSRFTETGIRRSSAAVTRTTLLNVIEETPGSAKLPINRRRSHLLTEFSGSNRNETVESVTTSGRSSTTGEVRPPKKKVTLLKVEPAKERRPTRATTRSKTIKVITDITKTVSKEVNKVISYSKSVNDVNNLLFDYSN